MSERHGLFMTEKVELLAPAGNYESFLGAIHAGADAVYLGGEKFGARAFADNFTTEKLCQAIRYAHLWEKKIYLTVNTLVKENEFSEIYDYLKPFYEEGLDGVIVQDIGVFEYIKEQFPDMELHVSTQMTITGRYGAKLLKEMGAKRIVPARELSLTEIIKLKEETGLELETFIHGAMCYCYSGQCLFSSIVGGRSGNRGKCAQPCRLPYQVFENDKELTKGECYPLSLKDMCTIQNIPEFIEAGIHSFKIEGRMKKPEYVAGVTAIYRKYIDLYYQKSKNSYQVSTQDMQKLSSLYIRSEIQDGYYHKHNGKDMVTLTKPGYSASDETLLAQIRTNYLENSPKLPISIALTAKLNKPLCLTIQFKDRYVSVEKGMVEAATKQPITSQNIEKQLLKLGETCFKATACQIDMDDFIFVSLKVLNELRREGILALEDAILKHRKSTLSKEKPLLRVDSYVAKKGLLYVSVRSKEQFEAIFPFSPYIDRLYIDIDLMLENPVILQKLDEREDITLDVYASLPFILRLSDDKYLKDYTSILLSNKLQGCLVKNLEEIQYLKDINFQGKIALDAGLYAFNQKATNTSL